MNKKKVLALVTSVGLIGAIGVGATLAYFTDNDTAGNVVTMGHVDIGLTESVTEAFEEEFGEDNVTVAEDGKGITYNQVVPGDFISKIADVDVKEDSQPAYLRMKMEVAVNLPEGVIIDGETLDATAKAAAETRMAAEVVAAITGDAANSIGVDKDWVLVGDYYYYTGAVNGTESTDANGGRTKAIVAPGGVRNFLTSFTIPETWGNEVADVADVLTITLTAEAVQSDNFTVDMTAVAPADPWGNVSVETFVPQQP